MPLKDLSIDMSMEILKHPLFLFLFIVGIIGIIISIIKRFKK